MAIPFICCVLVGVPFFGWYFHHIKYQYFVLYSLDKLYSEQTLWHSLWKKYAGWKKVRQRC